MSLPGKKSISTLFILIGITLAGLLILGVRQYRNHQHHEKIVSQTENLLFQYAIIREHIIESIMSERSDRLSTAATEMESLHANISRIIENAHIPDEYKLTFINQIDLPGIILLLKDISSGPLKSDKVRHLNEQTRALGEKLMLFDRVIISYAQRSIVGLQSMIIGCLALAVFALVNVLFLGYQRLALPVLELVREISNINRGGETNLTIGPGFEEIRELSIGVNTILQVRDDYAAVAEKYQRILHTMRQCLDAINGAKDRDHLLREICRAILTNFDYCLVWIGFPDQEKSDLLPLVADGSTTMNSKECKDCLSGLLALAEEQGAEKDQAMQAFETQAPVVRYDILAQVPKGPFKNTSLCDSPVSCASIPLHGQTGTLGVMNIYALKSDIFDPEEVSLLQIMADSVGHVCGLIESRAEFLKTNHEKDNSRAGLFKLSQLTALGEIAADIAHEINNLSNGIINYAQVLNDRDFVEENPAAEHELCGKIIKEGERIAQISNKIITYSAEGSRRHQSARIEKIIDEAIGMVTYQFKNDGIKITKSIEEDLPALAVDSQGIQHVFLNLLNNCRQALNQKYPGNNDNKRLDIRCETARQNDLRWLRITLTDFGIGIAPEALPLVFDLGFSTKAPGSGSGMGLNISREIIEEHSGTIRIDSLPGKQTTVTVDLPMNPE